MSTSHCQFSEHQLYSILSISCGLLLPLLIFSFSTLFSRRFHDTSTTPPQCTISASSSASSAATYGNAPCGALAQRGEAFLLDPQPQPLAEPFPGLVGTNVNVTDGTFLDGSGGWVGGDDSFYEYLLKMYIYDPAEFAGCRDRWVLAVESSMAHLASHPVSRPDLTFR